MIYVNDDNRVIWETRLAEAEAAWHALNLGNSARVFVDQNGERVEYTPANRIGLRTYILELRKALGFPTGISGPIQPWMIP
jgi:hypothetical protein